MTWLEFAERFQTTIVGLVGFMGVIFTLIVNAWIARGMQRQTARLQRQEADEAIRHRRIVLATSIACEFRSVRQVLHRASRTNHEIGEDDFAYVPVLEFSVSRSVFGEIGLLSDSTIHEVLEAISQLEMTRDFLSYARRHEDFNRLVADKVDKDFVIHLIEGSKNALDSSIEALEGELKALRQAKEKP